MLHGEYHCDVCLSGMLRGRVKRLESGNIGPTDELWILPNP